MVGVITNGALLDLRDLTFHASELADPGIVVGRSDLLDHSLERISELPQLAAVAVRLHDRCLGPWRRGVRLVDRQARAEAPARKNRLAQLVGNPAPGPQLVDPPVRPVCPRQPWPYVRHSTPSVVGSPHRPAGSPGTRTSVGVELRATAPSRPTTFACRPRRHEPPIGRNTVRDPGGTHGEEGPRLGGAGGPPRWATGSGRQRSGRGEGSPGGGGRSRAGPSTTRLEITSGQPGRSQARRHAPGRGRLRFVLSDRLVTVAVAVEGPCLKPSPGTQWPLPTALAPVRSASGGENVMTRSFLDHSVVHGPPQVGERREHAGGDVGEAAAAGPLAG